MNKLQWYTVRQNNSGGYFIQNEVVDTYVSVQALSEEDALNKLLKVVEDHMEYCECCGERWYLYRFDEDDIGETPTYYGEPLDSGISDELFGGACIMHWQDGTVTKIGNKLDTTL